MVFWLQIRILSVHTWLWPLNVGRDISSTLATMRKFLQLARKSLMEDIVAVEDIDENLRVFERGKDKHDFYHGHGLKQPRNARPGTT